MDKESYSEKLTHQCMIRIQSIYRSLKSAEKKAADYMLKHPEIIATTTITEASELVGCSEATLVRIARKLGYTGYPMLKASIMQQEESTPQVLYEKISPEDSPLSIVNKVFQTSIQSMQDSLELLDNEQYLKALNAFKNADRILFVGAGDAFIVAYTGYLKFSRIGINSIAEKDFDMQLVETSRLGVNDLLVVISHSGRTQSLYEVAKYAKHRNATVLAITNYPISPIGKIADIVLLTATFVPNIYGEIMSKRIPELCIIESLYVNVVMRADKKTGERLSNVMNAISINKM